MTGETLTSYDHVAGFYDQMSRVYSLGQIAAAKMDQLHYLNPGERVLYIGCGGGVEALAAARMGCDVTAVDTSNKMLARFRKRLAQQSLDATVVCDRFQNLDADPFDAVCPNFFFNCFSEEQLGSLMDEAIHRVSPSGKLMIADVAPPSGILPARLVNRAYLHGAMLPFWLTGLVQWHTNHDYVSMLESRNWKIMTVNTFKLWRFGPVVFRNVVAKRR